MGISTSRSRTPSSLPVEIWQKILRTAIYVDEFLDPESFAGNFRGYWDGEEGSCRDDSEYWRVERERVKLTLVCSSWRDYLRQFENRFVLVEDILAGHIPRAALRRAIRLGCALYSPMDEEEGYLGSFFEDHIRGEGELAIEILDLGHQLVELEWIFDGRVHFLHVAVLFALSTSSSYLVAKTIRGLPNLRHFFTYKCGSEEYLTPSAHHNPSPVTLSSTNLITLGIGPEMLSDEESKWDLPSLRHLRLHTGNDVAFDGFDSYTIPRVLTGVGASLQSLHVARGIFYGHLPEELWDLCPYITVLHTSYAPPRRSPPPTHPIQRVTLNTTGVDGEGRDNSENVHYVRLEGSEWRSAQKETIDAARRWRRDQEPCEYGILRLVSGRA